MRQLILLRHARAVSKSASDDFGRVLAPEGRAEMRSVSAWLKRLNPGPDLALVSPSARTRETWSLAGLADCPATFDERLYEAAAETVLAVLADVPDECGTVLVVGHNPAINEVALDLAGDDAARARLFDFPTAGIAVLRSDAGRWADVQVGSGTLVAFEHPASLAPSA